MPALKILTYNIQSCRGTDQRVSLKRIARVIRKSGAGLVGLQETDRYMPRSYFTFQARYLAYLLGMHYVFGTASRWFRYFEFGNAVLSKYPIIKYHNTQLPGKGEPRALLEAVILFKQQRIQFFNTHLGLNEEARELQVNKIIEHLGDFHLPTILVGDFNTIPADPVMKRLAETFKMPDGSLPEELKTFPANAPQDQIDYVFLSQHWKLTSLEAIESQASDHLPLLGKVKLTKGMFYR